MSIIYKDFFMKVHHFFLPLFAVASSALQAETTITLNSDAGDYIGQGESYVYTDENSVIQYSRNYDNGITVRINNLPGAPSDWWTLNIAAPGDAEIQAGIYENATRFPFQDVTVPGLSFSGNGRGCNTLTGWFEVYSVSYDATGNVESLNMDFEQHCEGGSAALHGSVNFNTTTPVGARANGLDLYKVLCRNRTSGQKVVFTTDEVSFDCKQEGLQVNPGDSILIKMLGTAQ
ncbi:MAG: hypothetical protein AB2688_18715 [Candidatus Thiodiazotropha taylori]|nr:hypothetical protein [Candidatus Thiodiazotropha taylori]